MIIQKGTKLSKIGIYKDVISKVATADGGAYVTMAEGGLICFVTIPRIRKEELNSFKYRTKKLGYITNEKGLIALIADNILATELCFYPYPQYREQIASGNVKDITVILADTAKDKVEDIRTLFIPEDIQAKLQEQWLMCIDKGITFAEHNRWINSALYCRSCKENSARAEKKQAVSELTAEHVMLFI